MADKTTKDLELEDLKNRATVLGIRYDSSVDSKTLSGMIRAELEKDITTPSKPEHVHSSVYAPEDDPEALVRIRVTCMDPLKKDYESDIFTTGNAVTPTLKKCVPFNKPFHVPRMIYNMMKQKQHQVFVEIDMGGGKKRKEGRLVHTYAIEVLPMLTDKEFHELKQRQLMAEANNI